MESVISFESLMIPLKVITKENLTMDYDLETLIILN